MEALLLVKTTSKHQKKNHFFSLTQFGLGLREGKLTLPCYFGQKCYHGPKREDVLCTLRGVCHLQATLFPEWSFSIGECV